MVLHRVNSALSTYMFLFKASSACFKYSEQNKGKQGRICMSYCTKCGNKVDETMDFCPRCGAPLKAATTAGASPQTPPPTQPYTPYPNRQEKQEKNEKNEKQEKEQHSEKHEKGEYSFVGYLIGGLILIVVGFFSLLQITNQALTSGGDFAVMLLIIGVIIIVGAVYVVAVARKHTPRPT
jgi:hypothetical protein